MGKSGTLKLTDFGFARELAPDERLYSQFGTPEYVAAEVRRGCDECLLLIRDKHSFDQHAHRTKYEVAHRSS